MKKLMLLAMIIGLSGLAGCTNAQEKGTGGAVLGGVLGGVIGHQSNETGAGVAIGSATGAVLGYMLGNEQDKAEARSARGHWEYRDRKVWVPGRRERVWAPPTYETRYDACGEPYRVLVVEGHWEETESPGYWETTKEKVWVE